MIKRNLGNQIIYFPPILTLDGVAVTSGVDLIVSKSGDEMPFSGDLEHVVGGVWKYSPTQSETDTAILGLILTAQSAPPVVLNLVTTASIADMHKMIKSTSANVVFIASEWME